MRKVVVGTTLIVVVIVLVVLVGRRVLSPPQPQSNEIALGNGYGTRGTACPAITAPARHEGPHAAQSQVNEVPPNDGSAADVPPTEQEKLVAATELLVEGFDSLVDVWSGLSDGREKAKSVTMADVDKFAAAFRKLPKNRRDECIHRALNLIPDENVMLLAGVLMDKTMDKEIVETVYNDVLNRDEDVKKPILQQIFKDKSHPCWADTAWILDVTGELPKAK